MNGACREIRKRILEVAFRSGHGHIPTCFSVVELLYTLYEVMKHDPAAPDLEDRDIFVLSKGHAALAHYAVLEHYGYLPKNDIDSFGSFESAFGCHADRHKVPGIEVSTGSLGHGITIAAGMALSFKINNSPRKVYTLIGDGESNEGTVWEALMVADNLKLGNRYTVIYDDNRSHARGLQIDNPADKFKSFGCHVIEVPGHSVEHIKDALNTESDRMKLILASTDKGHGSKTLVENHYAWHRRSPNQEELKQLLEELDETAV